MLTIEALADGRLRLAGRLDALQAAAAQAALDAVAAPAAAPLRLDCAALAYVSSAGLGVLLKTHKRLLAAGSRLRLEAVPPALREILAHSGFDQILDIAP